MTWSARLERPVVVPGGKPLVTLSDARQYILGLTKEEQHASYVRDCIEALLMAAEGRGPVFIAHAGVVRMAHGAPTIGVPTTGKKERAGAEQNAPEMLFSK